MCGICGFAGEMSRRNWGLFTSLLELNAERGMDSTGVCVYSAHSWRIVKQAVPSPAFVGLQKFKVFERYRGEQVVVLGHTRLATVGKVSKRNAHPFKRGPIIGVHNGHVTNYASVARKLGFRPSVDSEVIFEAIAQGGKGRLAEIKGSLAIAYVKVNREPTLHLARDWLSDLGLLKLPEAYFFSSSLRHLRKGMRDWKVTGTPFELPEDELWRVSPMGEGQFLVSTHNLPLSRCGWVLFGRNEGDTTWRQEGWSEEWEEDCETEDKDDRLEVGGCGWQLSCPYGNDCPATYNDWLENGCGDWIKAVQCHYCDRGAMEPGFDGSRLCTYCMTRE
jgi:asparagine synthetase B (glutamine-hydrolysing)